jgi:hypothetical protein
VRLRWVLALGALGVAFAVVGPWRDPERIGPDRPAAPSPPASEGAGATAARPSPPPAPVLPPAPTTVQPPQPIAAIVPDASVGAALDAAAPPQVAVAVVPTADAGEAEPPPSAAQPPAAWQEHHRLAAEYFATRWRRDGLREIDEVLRLRPAARRDAEVIDTVVSALDSPDAEDAIRYVIRRFGLNAADALGRAASTSASWNLRHNAYDALDRMAQIERVDRVAMLILDLDQARTCGLMWVASRALRASGDARVGPAFAALRERGRNDPHVECLGNQLSIPVAVGNGPPPEAGAP